MLVDCSAWLKCRGPSTSSGWLSDDYLTPEGPRGKLVLTVHAEKAWAICVRSMRDEGLSSARCPIDFSVPHG